MAYHDFGIMKDAPENGVRYDEYEPEKYGCIRVPDDDCIELAAGELIGVDYYHHSPDIPAKGLCYTGITLIPPEALPRTIEVMRRYEGTAELCALLLLAEKEGKFVIHFGI